MASWNPVFLSLLWVRVTFSMMKYSEAAKEIDMVAAGVAKVKIRYKKK